MDSLHKNWEIGSCSNWEINNDNYEKRNQGKFAINRLNNPSVGVREKETVKVKDCNIDESKVNN